MGVSGATLIRAATNAPDGNSVRDFQAALRARYAAADWRDLIQPINDQMRACSATGSSPTSSTR